MNEELKQFIEEFNQRCKEGEKEEICSYCNDPAPSKDCCYIDPHANHWVEQKLVSKMDETNDWDDLWKDVRIEVNLVDECLKCKRKLYVDKR